MKNAKCLFVNCFSLLKSKPNEYQLTRCMSNSLANNPFTNPTALAERKKKSPVWSWNEWDHLEECVVGIPDNAVVPTMTPEVKACMSPDLWDFLDANGGKYWSDILPDGHWKQLQNEIEEFAKVLEGEGVKVVRPEAQDFGKIFTGLGFCSHGIYAAMPRDLVLVVGDELIESTMTWKSRYFEFVSYRKLLKGYYDKGAKWTVAPKPLMLDELLEKDYDFYGTNKLKRITTEKEICFDAADFFRCGQDIFGQRSQVTNSAAINWMRRHLAPQGIRVHELNFYDAFCMHVDATLVPVKPGVFLKNPKYPLVEMDNFTNCGWEFVDVPTPLLSEERLYMSSNYLAMNTLMMDPGRVFIEKEETGTQKLFESIGVKSIPVSMKHCFSIGGGFHCWTSDIKRRGTLENYFNWSKPFLDKYTEKYEQ